ncbi:MAG: tetratricopeptide repeat protein [Bacteroidota bacterium]
MKRLAFLLIGIISFGTLAFGQNLNKYDYGTGDDSVACLENLSVYQNRYRNEVEASNFTNETINAWRRAFLGCPKSSKNMYSPHGINIMESLYKKAESDDLKKAYLDTIRSIYDKRIQYFGDKYKYLGLKGADLFMLDKYLYEEAFELCKLSVDSLGNDADIKTMIVLMQAALIKVGRNTMTKTEAIQLYQQLDEIFKYNSEKGSKSHAAWREKLELIFLQLKPECSDLIAVFETQYKETPEDVEMLKKITDYLSKDCDDAELYLQASVSLDKLEPSAKSKKNIAEMYVSKGNTSEAIDYFKQAVTLEEDSEKKAELYYRMANVMISSPQTSVAYARKALDNNPNFGKAYLLIARQYAAAGDDCGEGKEFPVVEEWKALWAAEDICIKAKSVDPSIASDANRDIAKYRGNFPDVETMFGYNITEGSEQTISCWFTAKTTAKAK